MRDGYMKKYRLMATAASATALLWISSTVWAQSTDSEQNPTPQAEAQSTTQPQPQTQTQTFQVEPIRSGFLLAPDVKFTELDGSFGNLVGGYGGWLEDQKFFIGAGAYWLTNGGRGTGLSYGGAIVEWFATRSEPVTFSLRALVGGGSGSLPVGLGNYPPQPFPPFRRSFGMFPQDEHDSFDGYPYRGPATAVAHVGFFVAEPQMNLFFKLGDWLRLGVGAGYRFIDGASGLDDRLKGVTGNIALQFRFF